LIECFIGCGFGLKLLTPLGLVGHDLASCFKNFLQPIPLMGCQGLEPFLKHLPVFLALPSSRWGNHNIDELQKLGCIGFETSDRQCDLFGGIIRVTPSSHQRLQLFQLSFHGSQERKSIFQRFVLRTTLLLFDGIQS
jgi:hypothetical protein